METPLKERLVGAAVLVALVVLVLPELFTGRAARPPPAVAHDAGGVPLRTHQFDLGNAASPAVPAPADDAAPGVTPAAPTEAGAMAVPAPAEGTASPPPDLPPAAPSGIPDPAPTAATPRPAPAAPVTVPPAAAQPRVTAPPAAVAPRPAAPPKPAMDQGASGWVVQLGSFATRANAEKLVGELRGKGYRAFTLPYTAGGRTLHRVRVGPEQDRDRADALARRLKGDGYPGTVAPHP